MEYVFFNNFAGLHEYLLGPLLILYAKINTIWLVYPNVKDSTIIKNKKNALLANSVTFKVLNQMKSKTTVPKN